jgi:hypothetical protein
MYTLYILFMSLSQAAAYDAPPDKLISLVDRQVSLHPSTYVSKAVGGRSKSSYKRKQSRHRKSSRKGGCGKKTNKTRKTHIPGH